MIAPVFEMKHGRRQSGFSLVEVIVAVGLFAGAIVVVLALLPLLARQASEAAELRVAQQLPDAVSVELQRMVASQGFDAFVAAVPPIGAPFGEGLVLVGSRDGLRVRVANAVPGDEAAAQYYAVEVLRFAQPPLAYDPAAFVLPLYVRVSWPYRVPGAGAPTVPRERRHCGFTLAIHR